MGFLDDLVTVAGQELKRQKVPKAPPAPDVGVPDDPDGFLSESSRKRYVRYDPDTGERYAGVDPSSSRWDWPNHRPSAGGVASPGRASSGGVARTKKARTYVRYDPDSGERVLVTKDDPRYSEWSNRKPPKGGRTGRLRKAATDATIRELKKQAKKHSKELIKAAEDAAEKAAPLVATGIIAIIAGVAAYYFVKVNIAARASLDERRELLQNESDRQLLKAKAELRDRLGRMPTKEEHALLYSAWKEQLAANYATLYSNARPGRE